LEEEAMKKRILSLALAATLLFACAPMAAAQRSISNPNDAFTLPADKPGLRTFRAGTWNAGSLIFGSVFEQILTGKADPKTIMRMMEKAPLIRKGDALPPQGELYVKDLLTVPLTQGMRGIYIALRETGQPDEYQFVGFYTDRKGETRWTNIGAMYNSKTGLLHSATGDGLLGLGYEYEAGKQLVRVDANNSWHRRMGYSVIYDTFSYVVGSYIDTLRFPFEYNGKDYMVQIWRGIYSWFANGGEIGLYEKPKGRPVFWDCSDTQLDISMRIYRGGSMLFDYGTQHTWWIGGFSVDTPANMALPRALGMTGSIAFEDPAMLKAFLASFEKNKSNGITGAAKGMVFAFEWQAGR
jgi:hypothetical protein